MRDWREEYVEYVRVRIPALRRLAYHLCGEEHTADDLVQETITKLYVHWKRASEATNIDSYVRAMLVRTFLDDKRRGWSRVTRMAMTPDRATGRSAVDRGSRGRPSGAGSAAAPAASGSRAAVSHRFVRSRGCRAPASAATRVRRRRVGHRGRRGRRRGSGGDHGRRSSDHATGRRSKRSIDVQATSADPGVPDLVVGETTRGRSGRADELLRRDPADPARRQDRRRHRRRSVRAIPGGI